jgi:hypothetical protein
MKKLITTNQGGMPLTQDDLGFIQEAYTEAFKGIISSYGIQPNESYKLSGAEVTVAGQVFTCTEGYIVLNGEVLPVFAQVLTVPFGFSARFVLRTVSDPAGLKQFKPPAGAINVYQLRYAELEPYVTVFPDTNMPYNAPYIYEKIRDKITSTESAWLNVGSTQAPFLDANVNAGGSLAPAAFRKSNDGLVMLKGTINVVNGSSCNLFRLPVAYRPSGFRCFVVSSETDNEILAYVVIQSDGYVALRTDVSQVSLDNIMFYQ